MLILMLLNLNTAYADTDADLCIIIMSLCNMFMQNSQCYKCVWGMSVNANEEILAGYDDCDTSYSDADPDAT